PVGVIEVRSAFGGMALVRTSLLLNDHIFWYARKYNDYFLCEHIGFSERFRAVSQTKIGIVTKCKVFWDASTFGVHAPSMQGIRRNAPCPCGSGKRYKHCHGKVSDLHVFRSFN